MTDEKTGAGTDGGPAGRRLIGPPHAHLDAPCTDACYEPVPAPGLTPVQQLVALDGYAKALKPHIDALRVKVTEQMAASDDERKAAKLPDGTKIGAVSWGQLTRFAKYVPPADAAPGDVERWHAGEWVPRDLPAGDVAAGEVAPARVRVAQQAVVDRAITLIDAATSSPEDVGWRMDALREAVEAITFPHGKPPAPAPVVTVPRGVGLDAEAIHNLRIGDVGQP